jgi:hypothetical protein
MQFVILAEFAYHVPTPKSARATPTIRATKCKNR